MGEDVEYGTPGGGMLIVNVPHREAYSHAMLPDLLLA